MYLHTAALVLNSEPLAENDRLITLYTQALGKVRAILKGARKTLSKINPQVQVGSEVQVVLTRGQEWWRLTAAQTTGQLPATEVFAVRWQWLAWYRFWGRVLKEEMAEEEIWQVCSLFQQGWATASEEERQLLYVASTLKLLYHLGYAPRWQDCGHCQQVIVVAPEFFYSWNSGVICQNCPRLEGAKVALPVAKLCRYFTEQPRAVWQGKKLSAPIQQQLANFLDNFLQFHFSDSYDGTLFSGS